MTTLRMVRLGDRREGALKPKVTRFLTVKQPFASLIAGWPDLDTYMAAGGFPFRPKRIENRSWPPPPGIIGQKIAIHAGLAYDHAWGDPTRERARDAGVVMPLPSEMPRGAVLAVARVTGYLDGRDWPIAVHGSLPQWAPKALAFTTIATQADWYEGPVGWLLDDVVRLPEPVPLRGGLGLPVMPTEVAEQVNDQLRYHLDQQELDALPVPPRAPAGRWINKWDAVNGGWFQEWVPA